MFFWYCKPFPPGLKQETFPADLRHDSSRALSKLIALVPENLHAIALICCRSLTIKTDLQYTLFKVSSSMPDLGFRQRQITEIDKRCYPARHESLEGFFMNVSLTPELDRFIVGKVESGRTTSASEVVREALRLLEEHDRVRTAQTAVFNQELGARLASLDRGERVEPGAARERLQQKSRERRKPNT
jgi:antitoxin ParD1/3/4